MTQFCGATCKAKRGHLHRCARWRFHLVHMCRCGRRWSAGYSWAKPVRR